ncbi:ABC transporter ATP-binding protein [Plantactinospora sp. GCM10030261]|uniref:ABC transporter ATP-binding protein n=1 Tax=Plantactinospora sp. GCM10030261 TaxID=3273420 RepID=UPI003611F8A5
MTALLAAEKLSRRYGSLTVVDRVDLRIEDGQRYALIGPNGAGKTTLLDLIGGAQRADGGTVRFGGRDITRTGPARRARLGIGRIHQRPAVWPTLTALDNVVVAALPQVVLRGGWRPWGFHRRVRRPAAALLDRMGLADHAREPAGHLSHGQRRQLEIAMALAGRPRLLLLDEPAAGLSSTEVTRLVELLAALPRTMSVLLVEHRLDLVYELADTVTVLRDGRVLATGGPAEIRVSPALRQAFAAGVS